MSGVVSQLSGLAPRGSIYRIYRIVWGSVRLSGVVSQLSEMHMLAQM